MIRKLLLILVVLGVLAVIWFIQSGRNEFGKYKGFNVVLVTIDTLRADHLACYGYHSIRTPNLDRLANSSIVFENAFAHVPMTLPSHASILTGRLPFSHGIRDNAGFTLDPKITTLAETLKSAGYQTAAFISAFVLDSRFGLNHGFDTYGDSFVLAEGAPDHSEVARRAEATEAEVEAWLAHANQRKFFLWVHYYDPHDPYDPPEPYKTQYKNNLYDGEIAYTDSVFGKLMADLQRLKLSEKTLVILTGDHGESLGEHNERTHSLFIYDATMHVPLLMHFPAEKPARIKEAAGHVDIVPTILEALGIKPNSEIQGRSLLPVIHGRRQKDRSIYAESFFPLLHYGWSPLRSMTTTDYRFIDAPSTELYDRKSDSKDTKNVVQQQGAVVSSLQKELHKLAPPDSEVVHSQTPDAETAERLKALGYTSSTAKQTAASGKVDPKDRIQLLELISRAHAALDSKNYAYVVQAMNAVLTQDPNIIDAHYLLSTAFLNLGETEQGVSEMKRIIELKPDHLQTLYNLALFYQLKGDLQESERWYLRLLQYEPSHVNANLNLAALYLQSNQQEKAKPYIARVINIYERATKETTAPEDRIRLLEKLAEIYFKTGQKDQSEKALKEAISLNPNKKLLHFHLGVIYQERNDLQDAAAEYVKETQVNPSNYKAFFNLGVVYASMNRFDDAIASFQQVLRLQPQFSAASERIAQIKEMEQKSETH